MHKITSKFPAQPRGKAAQARLTSAYQQFLTGNPSREDCDLILADLADFTGFYSVVPPTVNDATARFIEGQRKVFHRIISFGHKPEKFMRDLEDAAFAEMMASNLNGHIT